MTTTDRDDFKRCVVDGVTLVKSCIAARAGVTFCFTERTGGVSREPFASLNLGYKGGDDPAAVAENRRVVLTAMGAPDLVEGLVQPNQVHGDTVAVLCDPSAPIPDCVASGADAVVCTVPDQAVMLLYADCTPVVLDCPGGFAIAHSGWRGTLAGISGKTARILARTAGCDIADVRAYIGPRIGREAYEVSAELLEKFVGRFGEIARSGERLLDLGACVRSSLVEAGVSSSNVYDTGMCTVEHNDRFFSHRAEHGTTGRHAAVAFMRG